MLAPPTTFPSTVWERAMTVPYDHRTWGSGQQKGRSRRPALPCLAFGGGGKIEPPTFGLGAWSAGSATVGRTGWRSAREFWRTVAIARRSSRGDFSAGAGAPRRMPT
jgi:hypothetical protein